ncbi:MAG: HDOD domain-containing protein [Pseudomonadota bacterium]
MGANILFTDDDEKIINAFRRVTRPRRNEHAFLFANSGKEAMDIISGEPIDFIVTDMRMPGIDGADLLEWVSDKHTGIIRFILSGEAQADQTCRIVGKSHRFFAKPCSPEEIISAIMEIHELRSTNGTMPKGISCSCWDIFTSPPDVFHALGDQLGQDNADLERLTETVSRDPSLSIRLLQVANSAYFGRAIETCSIRRAISSIGIETLRALCQQGRIGQGVQGEADRMYPQAPPTPVRVSEPSRQQFLGINPDPDVSKTAIDLIRLSMSSGILDEQAMSSATYLAVILGLPPQVVGMLASLKTSLVHMNGAAVLEPVA